MKLFPARDMDGRLEMYPVQPYFVAKPNDMDGTGLWMPDRKVALADLSQYLPRDWLPEIQPGQCVELETAKPAVVLDGELLELAFAIERCLCSPLSRDYIPAAIEVMTRKILAQAKARNDLAERAKQ